MHSTGSEYSESLAILANPRALGMRQAGTLERLRAAVHGRGRLVLTHDMGALAAACAALRDAGTRRIAIAGGDGTIMRVLSEMRRVYGHEPWPVLVLLPFGTVNTTARRVLDAPVDGAASVTPRARRSARERLDPFRVLDAALAERLTHTVVRFLDLRIDGELYAAATFGTGLVSHFFDEYARTSVGGLGRASQIFFRVLLGASVGSPYAQRILAPVAGHLTIDGVECPLDAFTLLVCSVFRNVGLGLKPTYRAGTVPERLHLVATDLAGPRLAPQAFRVLLGKALVAPRLVDVLTPRFGLEFAAPTSVILDGERIAAKSVEVSLAPWVRVAR
jgi:diacylglycerol kinase family enzyme